MDPAARSSGGSDAAAVIAKHHPDAGAAGSSTEPAAMVEGEPPPPPPPPAVDGTIKPRARVVAVRTERVPDYYIRFLLKRGPLRRPRPDREGFLERHPELRETILATDRQINLLRDVQEDMLRQHAEKGFAVVGAEVFDNGLKRLFCLPLPEEEDCLIAAEGTDDMD